MKDTLTNQEKLDFAKNIQANEKKLKGLKFGRAIVRLLSLGIFGFGVAGFFLPIPVPRLYLFLGCFAGSIVFHTIAKAIVKGQQKKVIKKCSNGKVTYSKYKQMEKQGEMKFLKNQLKEANVETRPLTNEETEVVNPQVETKAEATQQANVEVTKQNDGRNA